MMGKVLLVCSAVALLLAFFGTAMAQEPTEAERGRQHYQAARSYFEQGRYQEAAREFREAHRLSGRIHLLKNVAISLEHAGQYTGAVSALEEYLERAPDAEDTDAVEQRIERLTALAEEAREDGDPPDEAREGEGGSSEEEDAASGPPEAVESDEAAGISSSWFVLGGAGVMGAAALVTGLMAHSTYTDLQDECTDDVCEADRQDDIDSGETLAVVSTVLTGVAVAGAAVGLILLLGEDDGEDEPIVGLAPGPGDFGASARVRF